MESRRNKGEPDYYGSLERLPLTPVRGKPPPYASRRQQGSRRGNLLKGNRAISGSTGDLSSRSRTTSGSSNEGDGEDWGGGEGGGGDLGIPVMSRDSSDAPAHYQHQRHVSVSYSHVEHPSDDPTHQEHQRHVSVSYSHVKHPSDDPERRHLRNSTSDLSEDHIIFTPTPQIHHQRHGSVSFSLVYITDDSDERDETRSNTGSPDTSDLQPKIQEQGYSRSEQDLTRDKTQQEEKQGTRNMAQDSRTQEHRHSGREQGLTHNKTQQEEKQGTRNMAQDSRTQEHRHSGREQGLIQNKAQQEEKQGTRNMAQGNRTQEQRHIRKEQSLTWNKTQEKQKEDSKKPQERLRSGAGDMKDSNATSPVNTTERRPRSGSTSNTSSLKNYRELAAIPDHTLVKWKRSKSMNDVTGDDDAKDFDKERKSEGGMKRAQSFDTKYAGDCEKKNKTEMRGRERYSSFNDDKEQRNMSERRRVASYSDTKNAGDAEKKDKRETRGRERYSSTNDDKKERITSVRRHVASYNNTMDAGDAEKKDERETRGIMKLSSANDDMDERNTSVRRRIANYNDTKNAGDVEKKNERETRGRERYSNASGDKEERSKGEMRHRTSYKDTVNAGYNETKNESNMRHRESYLSTKDDMEGRNKGLMRHTASYSNTTNAGKEDRSKDGIRQISRPLPATDKSENQVAKDKRSEETRHFARYLLVASKTEDEAESVREGKGTTQRSHHVVTSPSSPSSSSSSSSSPSHSPRQSVQEGSRGSNAGDGVFVATPVFLEGSPSSSPPPSIPTPSTGHQGSLPQGAEQDPLTRERDSALSTLRKEIQHLTRLKEEIEQNLIKSQAELKEQVVGLREERGGLEAAMEQREKRLHVQEEEIKDLKDTIAQLQILVFASDGEARLQRQASDLQEQLREERRYRQEETKQLRREVRVLTSRLQEKEQQLAKYKSDPTLSSWGSEMPEKGTAGSWKTSLPDVRKELSPTSLGASVAERRRSFSSLSDCSDDSHFSTAGSFVFRKARAMEEASARSNESAGRSYKAAETSGKPNVATVNDSRPRTAALTSGKFDKAPAGETRPRGVSARLDKTVDSSGKPNIAAVSHSRLNEVPTRSSITMGPSGKTDKAPAGETRPWRAPVRPDSEVEVSRRSNITAKDDSILYAVPLRLETAVEPSRTPNREYAGRPEPDVAVESSRKPNREHASQTEPDMYHIGSRKPLVTSGNVASLDLLPSSLTVPLGDTILSDTEDSQRFESGDGGRTRVKTAVYVELGDYTRPGVHGGGIAGGEGENLRTGDRGLGAGVFEGGRGEVGDYLRTGNRGLEARVYEGGRGGEGEFMSIENRELGAGVFEGNRGGERGHLRAGNRGLGVGMFESGRGEEEEYLRTGNRGLRAGVYEGSRGREREHLRPGNRGLGGAREGDYAKRGSYERGLSEGGREGCYESGHEERNHARLGGVDGDYGRPGRGRGGNYETGLEGNHARPGGGAEGAYKAEQKERDSVRSESYKQALKTPSQNPVTKSTAPPVPHHHTTSSGQPPHISRPVTIPPQPPQFTRTPTVPPQPSGTSQVTKQTPQPPQQLTRSFPIPSQGRIEGQARLASDVEYGRRSEHRVESGRREMELPRIVGYIWKTEAGVQRGVEDGRREAELGVEYGRGVEYRRKTEAGVPRGVENGRREAELDRGMEFERKTDAGVQKRVENVRRDTEIAREVEYGRKTDADVHKRVEHVRRDTEIARGEEHGRKTDRERPRTVDNGRRETGSARGEEYGRKANQERQREVKIGRRETPLARVEEYRERNDSDRPKRVENARWSNQEAQRGVDIKRNQDSELTGGNVRVTEAGNTTPNTTYITATVLCLYNLPYLRHFFTAEFPGLGVRSEVARAVSGVFSALENGPEDGIALNHLREAVGRRNKIFQLHQDPAAADFLSSLLVWLHDDLTPEAQTQGPSAAASVISKTFHGLRESLITCPMRGEVLSAAMEFFNVITLSVPGEGAWTLQELLARRFQTQEMAWECRLCGRRHPCTHQLRLLQPPCVLLLYLWRPSVGAASARVLFPEGGLTLNLHHHHHHQQKDRILRSREYHLVGVVTREAGNSSSTHSAFYRRLEGAGGWQAWREQRVAAVSRREVLSQQSAHLLFYVQQEGESQQASGSSRGRGGTRDGGMVGTCV